MICYDVLCFVKIQCITPIKEHILILYNVWLELQIVVLRGLLEFTIDQFFCPTDIYMSFKLNVLKCYVIYFVDFMNLYLIVVAEEWRNGREKEGKVVGWHAAKGQRSEWNPGPLWSLCTSGTSPTRWATRASRYLSNAYWSFINVKFLKVAESFAYIWLKKLSIYRHYFWLWEILKRWILW